MDRKRRVDDLGVTKRKARIWCWQWITNRDNQFVISQLHSELLRRVDVF